MPDRGTMTATLDSILAEHLGPVLLGSKPAALFSLTRTQASAARLGAVCRHHGLACRLLRIRDTHLLVYVYHAQRLLAALQGPVASATLATLGYPERGGPPAMLDALSARIGTQAAFPHEIGFFLGYPPEDVLGFIRHKGRHCKKCGLWKVYGDVAYAASLSGQWQACKQCLLRHLKGGGCLCSLPAQQATG